MGKTFEQMANERKGRVPLFKLKPGKTKETLIIPIGIAKAHALKGRINRLRKQGIKDYDILDLMTMSRGQLRGHAM